MFRVIVVFFGLSFIPVSTGADTLPGPIPAEVVRVIDGDTVRVKAKIWVDQTVEVSVRFRGIDAPEIFRPKCENEKSLGRAAKATVAAHAPVGSIISITNITRDKYGGRVVASVLTNDGETLAARLLAQGQAILEGVPKPWCSAR